MARNTESPILTLKVRGPGVRSGRITVPDLIRICQEAQNAVRRQAESIEGQSISCPVPSVGVIQQECTLELIGIKKGSTTLHFGLARQQAVLPSDGALPFGVEVVRKVAEVIKSLGNGNRKRNIHRGVLRSLYDLGGWRKASASPRLSGSSRVPGPRGG